MATALTTNNKKNRVLFFDDDPFTVKSLTLNLGLLGWIVTFVSDIDEMFHELNRNQYDILILDIVAPVPEAGKCKYIEFLESEIDKMDDGMLTGVVLAKKVWSMDNFKKIPVLFHSARSNPIPSDKELQNNNCVFIRKPEFAKNVNSKLLEMLNY